MKEINLQVWFKVHTVSKETKENCACSAIYWSVKQLLVFFQKVAAK